MKRQEKDWTDSDLLVKYLAGEATAEECLQVEQWLAESETNRKQFAKYQSIFEESKALVLNPPVDVNRGWERFKEKIESPMPVTEKRSRMKIWLSIAACLLVCVSISTWLYFMKPGQHDFSGISASRGDSIKSYTTLAATTQPLIDSLPDGSFITLNSHSALTYQKEEFASKRAITLKGEAFFNVIHDENRPFSVKVNDVLVNVLGTSFNVRSIGAKTEIIVESGVVGVAANGKSMKVYSGEELLIDPANANWKKEQKGAFDFNKYPGLLQAILKNPNKWPGLLKNYMPKNDTASIAGKNREVVRNVIHDLIQQKIVSDGGVVSFRLNQNELIVNDKRQPDAVQQWFKAKYIKQPDFTIYYGGLPPNGKGIFVNPDSM